MRRSSPDSTSGRSPDSPDLHVHLTARSGSRDPRRHRFDAVVAAFVAACRAEVLSERTIEFYLEGLNAYRHFAGGMARLVRPTMDGLRISAPTPISYAMGNTIDSRHLTLSTGPIGSICAPARVISSW